MCSCSTRDMIAAWRNTTSGAAAEQRASVYDHATHDWSTPPETIGSNSSGVGPVSVAITDSGDAAAVWTSSDISAIYGAGVNTVDVTERIRGLVNNGALTMTVDTPTLNVDPAPGTEKFLHIRYRFNG